MDKEERIARIDCRNELIELNYKFFCYVAHCSNVSAEYASIDDKIQVAVLAFMKHWWKYKWVPKYRDDLSFGVFFKPRIQEEIRRALIPFSEPVLRSLAMEASKFLNKRWTEILYEDTATLMELGMRPDKVQALRCYLSVPFAVDIEDVKHTIPDEERDTSIGDFITDKFSTVEELLIQEMLKEESRLSDEMLHKLADIYSLNYYDLRDIYPKAVSTLYKRLKHED
jgi:hypothetical protein